MMRDKSEYVSIEGCTLWGSLDSARYIQYMPDLLASRHRVWLVSCIKYASLTNDVMETFDGAACMLCRKDVSEREIGDAERHTGTSTCMLSKRNPCACLWAAQLPG
jgi:hypothetical protein